MLNLASSSSLSAVAVVGVGVGRVGALSWVSARGWIGVDGSSFVADIGDKTPVVGCLILDHLNAAVGKVHPGQRRRRGARVTS